jgi:ribosomal protein S11
MVGEAMLISDKTGELGFKKGRQEGEYAFCTF